MCACKFPKFKEKVNFIISLWEHMCTIIHIHTDGNMSTLIYMRIDVSPNRNIYNAFFPSFWCMSNERINVFSTTYIQD